jgi:hypothetical protein
MVRRKLTITNSDKIFINILWQKKNQELRNLVIIFF